ncbi:hypothetical protein L6164_008372 [Bauhinia variegata]|uniref:Uncharacterized protein n=1 Tax=Bauhinia variegata TaxID=167791 RepID=A0ACB9PHN7_BAUVA|nr:hypothetical protein L6164_008372 [Bauhinia variegata]
MPVAKPKASSTPDVMKAEDANDSIDTIIRQAFAKEPFLSFSRAGDSPAQWIQFLHALDQPEHPGWPLLSPLKVQLQKCDKCSQEFCSPINYRRHIRVHHRWKKLDKDSTKNRDLLGAYWDKLSIEEGKEVVSFKNVMLEDVEGSSILKALTTPIRKPGFSTLPQYYLKAGSALLDIIQARISRFISSQELFSILDDASEKTFLCGTAESMQKYIFDGEAGKIGLDPKNIVASTSFLLEQKLVKAWLADKDAEALRCQKLLVEEEEAAQKRQAEILERKRQKKLRQKEQKAREQRHEDDAEIRDNNSSTGETVSSAVESSEACNNGAHNTDTFPDHILSSVAPFPNINGGVNGECQSSYGCEFTDLSTDHNIERRTAQGHNRQRMAATRWQVLPKSQWAAPNGFHTIQNQKLGVTQKQGTHRDQRAAPIVNGNKVWTRKPKPETDGVILKARPQNEPEQVKSHEVLIGSISVTLGNCSQSEGEGNLGASSQEDCTVDNLAKLNGVQEKPIQHDSNQSGNNRLIVKLWRPVSRHGSKDPIPVQNSGREADTDAIDEKGDDQNLSDQSSLRPCDADNCDSSFGNNTSHLEDNWGPESLRLSSHAAKAFLAQRWKEAISSNHVKLVLSLDSEPPMCPERRYSEAVFRASDVDRYGILASAENRLVSVDLESANAGAAKSKLRMKPEKVIKIKYIPKQKTAT